MWKYGFVRGFLGTRIREDKINLVRDPVLNIWSSGQQRYTQCQRVGSCIVAREHENKYITVYFFLGQTLLMRIDGVICFSVKIDLRGTNEGSHEIIFLFLITKHRLPLILVCLGHKILKNERGLIKFSETFRQP